METVIVEKYIFRGSCYLIYSNDLSKSLCASAESSIHDTSFLCDLQYFYIC